MGKPTPTTTTSSAPNPDVAAAYKAVMDRASGVAQTPYSPYTGQLTAGLSPDQTTASGTIAQAAKSATPNVLAGNQYYGTGADLVSQGSGAVNPDQFSGEGVARFQNPYTDMVVNSTMGQIRHNNALQSNDLTSRGINAGNAFGGDRLGVAQAELARNQDIAGNQTISNLYDRSYQQAVQEFNNQQGVNLSAGQANMARMQQAGAAYGNLGQGIASIGQNFGNLLLNEGQAQAGLGATQQATQQAGLSAAQGQFNQAQAFPYSQTQWLSGIQSGLGSLSGGTSSTTGPAPNPMNQILGLGAAGAGAFLSDEHAKENKKRVGTLFDGQPIFSYNYIGHPGTQIGLIAQDVEKHHPEAVGEMGGLKTVNYADATADAAHKGHFASGGSVTMPYAGGVGWIPNMPMTTAKGLGVPQPKEMKIAEQDMSKLGSGFGKAASNYYDNNPNPGSSSNPLPGLTADDYGEGFARGGFADGGSPFEDRLRGVEEAIASGDFDPVGANSTEFKAPGLVPMPRPRPQEVIDPNEPIRVQGVYAANEPPMTPERAAANFAGVDDAPVGVASRSALPQQITGEPDELPPGVLAYARPRGLAPDGPAPGAYDRPYVAPPEARPQEQGLFAGIKSALPHMSPEAGRALMAAGLSMMASRSPYLGVAAGEGGLAGLGAYSASQRANQEADVQERKLGFEQHRIGNEDARLRIAQEDARRTGATGDYIPDPKRPGSYILNPLVAAKAKTLAEAQERTPAEIRKLEALGIDPKSPEARDYIFPKSLTVPDGFRKTTAGGLEPIPGGPADPSYLRESATAKGKEKPLPTSAAKSLADAGSTYADFSRLTDTFKPSYGGKMVGALGDAQNLVGRNVGGGYEEQAQWWQDYQTQKNTIRHSLFGSALTATEKGEFDKAAITPGMTAETIATNLARQKMIAERAARKLATGYLKSGYSPEAIEGFLGIPLTEIGAGETKGSPAKEKQPSNDSILMDARSAIAQGAPREAVIKRLREKGVDPKGL